MVVDHLSTIVHANYRIKISDGIETFFMRSVLKAKWRQGCYDIVGFEAAKSPHCHQRETPPRHTPHINNFLGERLYLWHLAPGKNQPHLIVPEPYNTVYMGGFCDIFLYNKPAFQRQLSQESKGEKSIAILDSFLFLQFIEWCHRLI